MRDGKPCSPRIVEEFQFEDGIEEAVAILRGCGFPVIILTNQPDIARRTMTLNAMLEMANRICTELSVSAVYICPHDDQDFCICRKPKPGMFHEAARLFRIDCSRSFIIGDSWKDMDAGREAGSKTFLLDRPYNRGTSCDYLVKNMKNAVELILKLNGKQK